MGWMFMALRRYADFNGRSRRLEYWMWTLFNVIVVSLFMIPFFFLVVSALHRVNDRGGISIDTGSGSSFESNYSGSSSFDGAKPTTTDDNSFRTDSGPATFDAQGNSEGAVDATAPSENGSDATDRSDEGGNGKPPADKVSALQPAPNAGILAYSYSGRAHFDVNPFMFLQEFGTGGWILLSLMGLWYLFTFIPNLAVAIRRLHDLDRSGWWIFIGLVPLVGGIVLLVFLCTQGTRGPNRFGADPLAAPVDTTFA